MNVMNSIDTLRSEIDRLENHVGDVEEKYDELQSKIEAAERAAEGARHLAEAVRLYLSWLESPPRDMLPAQYNSIRANFRQDVEYALRTVEG